MIKQYFKQALGTLRETPLVSAISILGTALSIAMVMVVVLMFQIKLTGYSPESNRGRMLYVYGTTAKSLTGEGSSNNGQMSPRVLKECYYTLKTPEAVTGFGSETRPVSLPGKRLFEEYRIKYTDPGFWKVFDFTFVAGHPFTEADFQSAIPVAVITDRLAATLFGAEEPVGKYIVVDYVDYKVVGVVKEVTTAASDAYAQIWMPYTVNTDMQRGVCEDVAGEFSAIMLAHSSSGLDAVRAELTENIKRFNFGQKEYELQIAGSGALDRLDIAIGNNGFWRTVTLTDYLLDTGALLLFLLLVPALNLISVVQSSVQKRSDELGLRRAFGASRLKLITQVLSENMIVTLIGSLLGLLLSVVFLQLCKAFLISPDVSINASMLLKPVFFISALFFATLLNLFSASIPAWRVSRQEIVSAINSK